MRTAGGWILTFGVIGALIALSLDVSVSDGMGGRVNNLGLMADRQNYLIAAALAVIVGVVLIVADKSPPDAKSRKKTVEEPLPFGIEEENGLFLWGSQVFPSREEAVAHVQQRLADHKANASAKT